MILGQAIIGLFLFSILITVISEVIRLHEIKQDYKKNGHKFQSFKEFKESNYNRI